MKRIIFFAIALSGLITAGFSQQPDKWADWKWLIGSWAGEGGGQPGQGSGTFSFNYDLDNNIIVRKSHSVYPASGNKPEVVHNDLMIVYSDDQNKPSKAIYFDNEGHIINYSVYSNSNSVVLTSEKLPGTPVFKLTYTLVKENLIDTRFEISQDGSNFSTYIQGKSIRQK